MSNLYKELLAIYYIDRGELYYTDDLIFINYLYDVGVKPIYEYKYLGNKVCFRVADIIKKLKLINYENDRK